MRYDPTTHEAFRTAATPQAAAEAVRDSLGSGTLTCLIKEGGTTHYSGTFAGPLTAGVDGSLSASAACTGSASSGGTPSASTWTLTIQNAGGTRWIEGTFGPGGQFTWDSASFTAGQGVYLNFSIASFEAPVQTYGLIFPSNGGGDVRFALDGANLPDITPLTLLWKIKPVQQTGFYTTFFHARNDGTFVGDRTYWGCHPYPQGGGSGTVHNWEVSIEGGDDIVDENGNSTVVTKDAWYSQAAQAYPSASVSKVDFYWDLATASTRVISHTTGAALTNASASPALTFGGAPWNPNAECLSGTLRGIQVYSGALSLADIEALHVCETDAQVLAVCSSRSITSLWYLNMNPTPDDITDKSGNGRNPSWQTAGRPTLYTG